MMHTRLHDRSTSSKPLKLTNEEDISDTMDLRTPTNQPLPETKNKTCGDTSIENSTKDVGIIEKGSCENIVEKVKMQY